jgi:hypothetical protein
MKRCCDCGVESRLDAAFHPVEVTRQKIWRCCCPACWSKRTTKNSAAYFLGGLDCLVIGLLMLWADLSQSKSASVAEAAILLLAGTKQIASPPEHFG